MKHYLAAAQAASEKATHPAPTLTPGSQISLRDLRGDGHSSDASSYLSNNGEAYSKIPLSSPRRPSRKVFRKSQAQGAFGRGGNDKFEPID